MFSYQFCIQIFYVYIWILRFWVWQILEINAKIRFVAEILDSFENFWAASSIHQFPIFLIEFPDPLDILSQLEFKAAQQLNSILTLIKLPNCLTFLRVIDILIMDFWLVLQNDCVIHILLQLIKRKLMNVLVQCILFLEFRRCFWFLVTECVQIFFKLEFSLLGLMLLFKFQGFIQ